MRFLKTTLFLSAVHTPILSAQIDLQSEDQVFIRVSTPQPTPTRPNIILLMADDMGWGDTTMNQEGSTSNTWINTPGLNSMASDGIRFRRFYSASPVCSPTRAACLTGRNPFRVNVPDANRGKIDQNEKLLSEVLQENGYLTGHFGKWHLGTLTTLRQDSNRGNLNNTNDYSPPWQHGYNFVFATEAKVPTFHPMRKAVNGSPQPLNFDDPNYYGTSYWNAPTDPTTWLTAPEGLRVPVTDNMTGDDSRVIMDRAIPFIQESVSNKKPFLSVIWFHTPHKPVVDPDGVEPIDTRIPFVKSIQGMDAQIVRLRNELSSLGIAENTMIWFCSDNGPQAGVGGSVAGFRGSKRSLFEGGVRVPATLVWPQQIPAGQISDFPSHVSDYYPTILDYLNINPSPQKPLDGISLRPSLDGHTTIRTRPMGFLYRSQISWVTHQHKLISGDNGTTWQLYDLLNDPFETNNLASTQPTLLNEMIAEYTQWRTSVNNDTRYPSDLTSTDSDNDGLVDDFETNTGLSGGPSDLGTNPNLADTDNDGWNDGAEIWLGTNPLDQNNKPANAPIQPDTDSDNDGLLDAWEIINFSSLAASPTDDPDGDNTNNLAEHNSGTNPNDKQSTFLLNLDQSRQGVYNATWPSTPGKIYQIQTSPDLETWSPLGSRKFGNGSTMNQLVWLPSTSTQDFYARVIIIEP